MSKSKGRTRVIRKHSSHARPLELEQLEPRELMTASPTPDPMEPVPPNVYDTIATVFPTATAPTVTLGNVVSMTEGFGYGTTLVGHGKAVDTTLSGVFVDGSLTRPLGLSESGKFTMEGWVQPKPGIDSGVIWNYAEAYQLFRVNNTGLRMVMYRSGSALPGATFDVTVADVLNADAWNHVAMTYDGNHLRLLVNGVIVADAPDLAPSYADLLQIEPNLVRFQGTADIAIPQRGAGALDDVQVWKVARTQAEIQAGMLNPRSGTEPGLVAYWNFDNPSGNQELDSSPTGNSLNLHTSMRIENPAPQIGYVDVNLDRPVDSPLGLWVTYAITGGTAQTGLDFLSSSFRKVSSDPTSERLGIIIPNGESTGRIYFMARPDAIFEPNETIDIALSSYSFSGGQEYVIGSASTASLTIRDNGAYRQGVAVIDAAGRPVLPGSPLFVDPATRRATFTVRLTSELDYPNVSPERLYVSVRSGPNAQVDTNGSSESVELAFTSDDWDIPQSVTLRDVTQDGTFTITGIGFPGTSYLPSPISFSFTLTPPNRADVEEGNPLDAAPVTPTVSLAIARNVKEGEDQPALVSVLLNTAAPAGGLDVFYTVLAPASGAAAAVGSDFIPLSGMIHVEEGSLHAEVPIYSVDDIIDEVDTESLVIRLSTSSTYTLGSQSQVTVVITDDDRAGISVVNPTSMDVATVKSLVRPALYYDEGFDPYGYGEGIKQVLPTVATYDVPGWTTTGGIAAGFAGQFDRDVIEFTLPANVDASAKIRIKFTPTGVNGQPTIATLQSGADEVQTVDFAELFQLASGLGTRLQGGNLSTPRLATMVSDDTLEWSLAGLGAGTYQLILQATANLRGILANFGATGVSYDYEAVVTSNPVAPYTLSTSTTIHAYSSTYAPLTTIETVPIVSATEPNNSLATAYPLATVSDGMTIGSQSIDRNTDVDYFRFRVDSASGRPDTIALLFAQNTGDVTHDLRLEVLSTTGSSLLFSDKSTENEYVDLSSLADGEYIAQISGATSAVLATSYTLKFRSLNETVEPENNEVSATATYLGMLVNGDRFNDFSVSSDTDVDYYRFTLNSDFVARPISINLISTAADGNLGFALYNATTNALIATQWTNSDVETLSLTGIADDDYILRVTGQNNGARNQYDLVFGPVTQRANQFDPNLVALRLDTKPTANVTLTLTNSDPTEGQLTVTTLLFTPDNWNKYQLVKITALDDASADGDITYTVTATASSADVSYQNRTMRFDVVNVDRGNFVVPDVVNTNDEPTAPVVTISAIPSGAQAEGQTIDAFNVSLAAPLSYALTVGLDFQRGTAIAGEDFTVNTGGSSTSALPELADTVAPLDSTYLLRQGSVIQAEVASGKVITLTVRADTTLTLGTYGIPAGGTRSEYAASVSVDISAADATEALAKGSSEFGGRIESEDIQIRLLDGPGYDLPLAPDKQGANPNDAANLDKTRTIVTMIIYDDDVPGVQFLEVGEHTTLAEGTVTTYQVMLTAEPLANVQLVLTPGGGIEFVNPQSPATAMTAQVTYALNSSALPSNIDLSFVSLNGTDGGMTAVFDVRLAAVTFGAAAKISTLSITGTNGGGAKSVRFEIPGANDVDYAGAPVQGTWNTLQRLVVNNLKANSNGSYSFTINLDGVAQTITLTPATTQVARTTTTLTFTPNNWFQPQTVTIRALENSIAEPGAWHQDFITYKVVSTDGNWNGISVPAQEIHIVDTVLDVGDTIEGLGAGLGLLEDSLNGLTLPLLGSVGALLGLATSTQTASLSGLSVTPTTTAEPLGFFEEFHRPLKRALASQSEITVSKFQSLAESALQPLVDSGVFDRVQVKPKATDDDVNIVLSLDKLIQIGQFDLSSDLGLEALGVSFATTGKARADLAFSLDIGFGWNKNFGFYLDTGATGLQMGARLYLTGNGATTANPNNLFTGQGSIGPLQLDFMDDAENRTELAVTFEISLNDLDNVNTVRFFDVNGDGLLAEKPYTYMVGIDANKDGRIDKNENGNPITEFRTVAEAWANVTAQGVTEAFPTVPSLRNDPNMGAAVQANWNTVGSKTNTFDEAQSIQREGIYRLKTVNDQTIVYLDLDRDGELDIARRNADPMTLAWTSLTAAERNGSEIWFAPANVKNFSELKILTTGTGTSTQYFVDVNANKIADAGEGISDALRKKFDKDGSKVLEGDVIQDGEGKYTQGTSLAFYDANTNGKLDFNEKVVSYGFDPFQLERAVFTKVASGNYILDFNRDGSFNTGQITTAAEFKLKTDAANGNFYLDIDGDSIRDPNEPQSASSKDLIFVEQSAVDPSGVTITFDGNTRNVLTQKGVRFIDLDGNGFLTLDSKGRALEPVARQSTSISFADMSRLVVAIDSVDTSVFSSVAAEVQKLKAGGTLSVTERQRVINQFAAVVTAGKIVEQLNDGDRLTLAELKAFNEANKQRNATKSDQVKGIASQLFTYTFEGYANLGLKTKTSIDGSTVLPAIQFDLAVNLPLFNFSNSKEADNNGLTVEFKNVAIDLGSFLANYVTPILETTNEILKPIKPIIQALNADTKLLGKLGMASTFESDGKPGISLLEIAKKLNGGNAEQAAKIDKAIRFADHLTKLVNTIDKLTGTTTGLSSLITFGDFSLSDFRAASDDVANAASRAKNAPRTDGRPSTTATVPTTTAASVNAQAQSFAGLRDKYNALKQLEGFEIKLFNPNTILSLITGESNVDLISYDIPDFDFSFMVDKSFQLWGPIAGKLEGGFTVATDLSMGFDTHGIEAWAKAGYAADKSYLVFDGLFLNDWTPGGSEKDELTVKAYVAAGLGIDVGIASGFLKGGVEGTIGFDFVDVGERSGTADGKVRGSDIVEKLSSSPADLFDLHGRVIAFLGAEINVNLLFFKAKVYEARLASFELAKFQLDASGFKGSALNGKVQSGPVAGATIWFDANNNYLLDDDEPWALTDSEGNYDLNIPDGFDLSTGEIRVAGGVDISTGLETTADFAIPTGGTGNATAFTSLLQPLAKLPVDTLRANFNEDLIVDQWDREIYWELLVNDPQNPLLDIDENGTVDEADIYEFERLFSIVLTDGTMNLDQSSDLIKQVFHIDPSVDLTTFAHFEESLSGNALAIPVILGINNLNTAVTQIEALLSGVAGVAGNDRAFRAFLSESIFLAVAKEMLDGALDLGDPAQLRRIVLDAAASASTWLTQRNMTLDFARLVDILDGACVVVAASVTNQRQLAALTNDPVELARSITKAKLVENGKGAQDLRELAQGTRTVDQVVADNGETGAEALEAIQNVPLPPLVSNVSDVFMLEDQIVVGIPLNIRSQSGQSGTLTIDLRAENQSLLPDGSFTLTPSLMGGQYYLSIAPAANRFGTTKVLLRVSDSAGTSVLKEFRVMVAGVNDAPLANPDSALVIAGTTVQIDPLSNDTDVDGDVLRVGRLASPTAGEVTITNSRILSYSADTGSIGTQTVDYEISDGNGGTATSEVTIQVLAPLTVDYQHVNVLESQTALNGGTYANVANVPVVLSASVGKVSLLGGGRWSWSWDTKDGPADSQTVTITAVYGGTTVDRIDFALKVANVAPSIDSLQSNAPLLDPTSPGRSVTVFGTFSDASSLDTHRATIHWGDGITSVAYVDDEGNLFHGQHVYAKSGYYEVNVSLTDSDQGTTQATIAVVVGGFADIHDGVLYVIGTAGHDDVLLTQNPRRLEIFADFLPGFLHTRAFDLSAVQSMVIILGDGDDRVTIAGNVVTTAVILGGDGNDYMQAGGGQALMDGGEGNDWLLGTRWNDIIRGGTGVDVVFAGDGDDVIDGGSGADQLYGGSGNDQIFGEQGSDQLYGESGYDLLAGGEGNDLLIGGSQNDLLLGNEGNDVLLGETGDDLLSGDQGEDILLGGGGRDLLSGGPGHDLLDGAEIDDALFGSLLVDLLFPSLQGKASGTSTDRVAASVQSPRPLGAVGYAAVVATETTEVRRDDRHLTSSGKRPGTESVRRLEVLCEVIGRDSFFDDLAS